MKQHDRLGYFSTYSPTAAAALAVGDLFIVSSSARACFLDSVVLSPLASMRCLFLRNVFAFAECPYRHFLPNGHWPLGYKHFSNAGWSGAFPIRTTEPLSRFRMTVGSLSRVTEPRRFRSAGWSAPVSAVVGGRLPCRTSEPHRRFRASGRGIEGYFRLPGADHI